jgi:hypothetical protein
VGTVVRKSGEEEEEDDPSKVTGSVDDGPRPYKASKGQKRRNSRAAATTAVATTQGDAGEQHGM